MLATVRFRGARDGSPQPLVSDCHSWAIPRLCRPFDQQLKLQRFNDIADGSVTGELGTAAAKPLHADATVRHRLPLVPIGRKRGNIV